MCPLASGECGERAHTRWPAVPCLAPTSRTPRPVSSCLCAGPASRSYAASRREAVPSKAVASAAGWRRRPSSSRERRARSAEHRSNASFRGRAVGCASRTHEGLSARGRQLNARGQHDCEHPRILTRPPPARARRSSVARARPSVSVAGARPGPLHWLCVRAQHTVASLGTTIPGLVSWRNRGF